MKRKFYIKHKIRLIITVLIFLSLNLGITNTYDRSLDYTEDNFEYIVAEYGDSIWSIVQDHYDSINKPYLTDFRDVVEYTSDLNGGYDIVEGQIIIIPKDIKK